ncbi:MAG: hypothetical protein BGN83_04670 [Rhizobium sp. 63-7]|nr:MAG: hypothetical protein BGN83_04670 [Rhizobium sp. 63-7]
MSQTLKKALQTYQQGDFPSALKLTERVISAERVRNQDTYALLGNTNLKLGRMLDAADAFAEASSFSSPKSAMLAKFAVTLYHNAGARDKILGVGERAVKLNPGDTDLAFTYVNTLFSEGRFGETAPYLDNLDRTNPQHMAMIVNCHRLNNNFEVLLRELKQACRLDPGNLLLQTSKFVVGREVCDVEILAEFEAIMKEPDGPLATKLLASEPALGRVFWNDDEAISRRPNADSTRVAAVPAAPARRAFSAAGEKIRIGYLSNDFYDHPTMRLFGQVLALHDRDAFDVTLFCHSDGQHRDWQERHFPPVVRKAIVPVKEMSDGAAADAISARNIDILVDLKGHTMNARLGIVNRSDAPVKATYLGYPGSVHGADLDYAITDRFVTPDASKAFFTEKLCRLPESYQANDTTGRPLPHASSRAEWSLPEDAFVFASFNAVPKITPRTIALWANILDRVPGSVLWILCDRPLARVNLRSAFAEAGIAGERILFTGSANYADHLARVPLADLALDTFPCNGHTTTSDMLWAGLPVLSSRGNSFASRVSESLLNAIGLSELVARDDEAFCTMATAIARAPGKVAELKGRLEENRFCAPLFNGARITAHLERAYGLMAERARAGLAPDYIDVPALPALERPFASRQRGG